MFNDTYAIGLLDRTGIRLFRRSKFVGEAKTSPSEQHRKKCVLLHSSGASVPGTCQPKTSALVAATGATLHTAIADFSHLSVPCDFTGGTAGNRDSPLLLPSENEKIGTHLRDWNHIAFLMKNP